MTDSREMLKSPLFQAVANLTFDSVMVTEITDDHKNSVIIYVNHAFTDLTGYLADEVLGKTPGLLQGPETEK
ncbi:PAS domain-containing protein, partial [Porticoccus sp.]|uniref:PAS domain-containing protein n=1 Tax=Porticoccus sp. TaxID=2024853 RepID=UPI003F6A3B88